MKVRITRRAGRQIEWAFRYIAANSPQGASHVRDRINEVIALIAYFPGIGHEGAAPGTREFPVPRTPYVVIYRAGAEVEIVAVMHGRQNRQADP